MHVNSIGLYSHKNILFSGTTGAEGSKMRKALAGITCPCCGIKMLTTKDLSGAMRYSPFMPSEKVIPFLMKYENRLHDVEKDILYTLKALSQDYPNKNLRELLNLKRVESLTMLNAEEKKIIERIRHVGFFLSKKSNQKLENTLAESEKLINDNKYDSTFKRRAFIAKVAETVLEFPEKDAAKTIIKIAQEMPKAGNNKYAFIVKYTEKKPATGQERNATDIVYAMMQPSLGTIEHIKARSPNVVQGGGKNQASNYILECQRDNNLRNCMPFVEFVKQHPEFYGEHLQKYMDTIIAKLKRGELAEYKKYPLQVSRTLRRQSKGKLNVDISKLNIPDA